MNYLINFLIDFGAIFVIVFAIHYYFLKRKKKKYEDLEDGDFVKNFIVKYDLDVRKTKFNKILLVLSFNNSFVLAFTAALIVNRKNYIVKIAVSFVVLMILIYALYELTGRLLKKKEGKKECTTSKK